MDPQFRLSPTEQGIAILSSQGIHLEYAVLRPDVANDRNEKVIMLNGACCLLNHYGQMAESMRQSGFTVLLYNHRGTGKSVDPLSKSQTTSMLAQDADALLQHLFGMESTHVVGYSMGGLVAQYLASILVQSKRLKSLFLGCCLQRDSAAKLLFAKVTKPFVGLFAGLVSFVSADMLAVSLLSKEHRESSVVVRDENDSHSTTATVGELWKQRFTNEFDEWFTYHNVVASRQNFVVSSLHDFPDVEAERIKTSGVVVTMWIPERDTIVPPARQMMLAENLGARQVANGEWGHVVEHPKQFSLITDSIIQHLVESSNPK